MRVVFMGTPAFAVPSLRALAGRHDVVAAYTRPDAVSGRGASARPSPVKLAAIELGIPLRQPRTLRDTGEISQLADVGPDVVCVAAYGLILPPEVLAIPPHGVLNVHASLLPRWRGAAPIQRAILAGDKVTGVSIMLMEEGLDTGPYSEVVRFDIGNATADETTQALAELGADALLRTIDRLTDRSIAWTPQDEALVTYAPKITKSDVELTPELTAAEAIRRVRASSSQSAVRIRVGDATMTLVGATRWPSGDLPAGSVTTDARGLVLGMAGGEAMLVERLKPDGKREMKASDWIRGARVSPDDVWGPSA